MTAYNTTEHHIDLQGVLVNFKLSDDLQN